MARMLTTPFPAEVILIPAGTRTSFPSMMVVVIGGGLSGEVSSKKDLIAEIDSSCELSSSIDFLLAAAAAAFR